jgi:DMSO/TMAO reductase YedYZ molybdopterin-dependent catalytic subunit
MPRRVTNDLLLGLLLAQVLGGVLGWWLPVATAWPLYDVHRALGVATVLVIGWKQAIALRSLRKRVHWHRWDRSVVWGSIAGVALLSVLGLGLLWTLNLIGPDLFWGYSPLNVHVIVGIGLVPLIGVHMLLRRRPNAISAPVRSRRTFLRVAGLSFATLAGWQAIERLAPAVRLPSGSKAIGSFNANAFPAEIWLFDSVPVLNPATWRVTVNGRALSLDDLGQYPRQVVQAVLDCTSGWWSEQVWSGVALRDLIPPGEVTVTSVTGHRISLTEDDTRHALLATHVGDEALSAGHGYPLRLVVPTRRGYYWVKWVATIEAEAQPAAATAA